MKKSSGLLDFSYSRMGMYLECPKKYEFRYIYRIPEKPRSYFAFGHAIHGALQFLYDVKEPPFPPLEEVLRHYKSEWDKTPWDKKGYASREKCERDFSDGLVMLGNYHRKHHASLKAPLAVEFKTTVEVDGLAVIMIADRIDYLGEGKVAVVDYKTGKDVERAPDQLHMYQKLLDLSPDLKNLAARAAGAADVRVEKMQFCHVPTLKEYDFGRAGEEELAPFWAKVLDVAAAVRAGRFAPSPGETRCRFCDYRERCLPHAGSPSPALKAAAPEPASPPQDALAARIDKYGELAAQSAKLAAELEVLRKEIIALMRERGFNRHFGKKFQARLEKFLKLEITDEAALLGALKETGLLKRTLTPTRKTVEKLLASADIPDNHRQTLERHARRREEFKLDCGRLEG